ncbi:MAG: glycosyltransferase [Candidatus Omnitrophica bacterium]|nr:glycosyltransferase [Candidatus Omnitrophota bacterium]MDD5553093.1 glycosyltransferase [Candidatus Omnitrophota bacterium]
MKPRIIYFQQNPVLGATEEHFYTLMEGMDKSRFDIAFICPSDKIMDPFVDKLKETEIQIFRYSSEQNHAILIYNLRKLFLQLKPNAIHFNDPCLDGIIAARLAGRPVLIMTHHTPQLERRYNFKGRLMEKIAFRYCGLNFIFVAERNKKIAINKDKIPSSKSFVIYTGLAPARFSQEYDKMEVYNEFGIPEGSSVVGTIGRLSIQKGINYLIEAAPLVVEEIKSVKFILVGEGELEQELKASIKKKGLQEYFIFAGFRKDIPRILSVLKALVMPSLFEGLSIAAIEAAAIGIPIIATDVGGMNSLVINGKTGLIVPPRDTRSLAEAISYLLKNPEEAKGLGLGAKKHFEEFFTQERMVKKVTELYLSLIGNPKIQQN